MPEPRSDQLSVNRRGLFLGAGVAALAGTALAGARDAQAAPASDDGVAPARADVRAHPDGSPIGTSIASAPIAGFTYRSVCMYDFEPFNPTAQKTWGGYGIYSAGTPSAMRASIEIPAGVLVRDIEYYVYNNTGANFSPDAYLYVPGQGSIFPIGGSVAMPSTGNISAGRATIAKANWGPYPSGSRLLISVLTPIDQSVQVNGARVGMTQGAGGIGLLSTPQRVYNTTHGAKFAPNEIRTVTLPADAVPPGTSAVLINLTAAQPEARGYLNAWRGDLPDPGTSIVDYTPGTSLANAAIVAVSAGGQLKIKSSGRSHVIVDLVGTVS